MESVRIGLVGAGAWAKSAHLPSLAGFERARWTAVAARRRESAEAAARAFAIPFATSEWEALVDHSEVDAVVSAGPAALRKAVALRAFARGKPVLCELPLALDAGEARELLAAARAAGVVHAYARPRPWLYGGERVRELVRSGELGQVESALLVWRGNAWLRSDPRASWRARADAGPPVLAGVALAVLLGLLGPAADVSARLARFGPADPAGPAPAPDHLRARLRLRSGAEAAVDAGYSQAELPWNGVVLHGARAALRWEWTPPRILLARGGAWEPVELALEPDLGRAYPFVRAFARAVLEGGAAEPDFTAGLDELDALEALLESSRSGGTPIAVRA